MQAILIYFFRASLTRYFDDARPPIPLYTRAAMHYASMTYKRVY